MVHSKDTQKMIKKYPNVFAGIGKMDKTVKTNPWDGAVPYQAGPRRVAYALQKPLHGELNRLVKLKIIAPLQPDEKSEWCNSFFCVTKLNGRVRLPQLAKVRYFSIFDRKSGYWNLELNLRSSYLTTSSCMHECFWILRVPFGLSCISDIFQCKIENLFHDLETTSGITDDMIVWGYKEDGSDHYTCAKQILQRCNE